MSEISDEFDLTWRRNLRWLHAGVYLDIKAYKKQIWYSFRTHRVEDGASRSFRQIVYAANKYGKPLGNRDVGQNKCNLITWNDHLQKDWKHFLTSCGQWRHCMATKGRRERRQSLMDKHDDPGYEDPYPDGNQFLNIGPSVNVIHSVDDEDIGNDAENEQESEIPQALPSVKHYPGTQITLDFSHIKLSAFKGWHGSSIEVAKDFLMGRMVTRSRSRFPGQDDLQVDLVESAFFDSGWRVDRRAVVIANAQVRHKMVRRVIDSSTWNDNPPIRYDIFKGGRLANLMDELRRQDDNSGNDDNGDDDDQSGYGGYGRGSGRGGGGGSGGFGGGGGSGSYRHDSSSGEDGNPLFISDRAQHNAQRLRTRGRVPGYGDNHAATNREKRTTTRAGKGPKRVKAKTNVDILSDGEDEQDLALSQALQNYAARSPTQINGDSVKGMGDGQNLMDDENNDVAVNIGDEENRGPSPESQPRLLGLQALRGLYLARSGTPSVKSSSSLCKMLNTPPSIIRENISPLVAPGASNTNLQESTSPTVPSEQNSPKRPISDLTPQSNETESRSKRVKVEDPDLVIFFSNVAPVVGAGTKEDPFFI